MIFAISGTARREKSAGAAWCNRNSGVFVLRQWKKYLHAPPGAIEETLGYTEI